MTKKVSPTQQPMMRANGSANTDDDEGGVQLKKEIGIVDAISIIVGVIVGSGIFLTPKGVLANSGSIGQAIIVWILSGVLSLIGALCYAELGTMIPKSGGDYAYISDAFGSLPSFLYLWVALFIIVPAGNAITAITFAQYILEPIWSNCMPSNLAVRLIAAVVICGLTAINCYNVKWATKVQDVSTGTKIFALLIIIFAGFYQLAIGKVENFEAPFTNTKTNPGSIALSMYSGLFSYSGWNYLNYVTEELKNPTKNLPKAICISLPLVTVIYVLTNVAYFVVMTPNEILSSGAVAVTFGNKLLGWWSWIMPLFVACSTFGALNGAIFASARLFFVGARDGKLPSSISLINVKNLTPMPSLIFLCLVTLPLLLIENVYSLINYTSFVEALFTAMSIAGLLWLRYKKPDLHRPIRVYTFLPVLFFVICIFLVVLPFFSESYKEIGVGIAVILLGIPVHFVCVRWQNKPKCIVQVWDQFNMACAKLFMCMQADKHY